MRLMESVGVALQQAEPALLVGETGTGKTTLVQRLADQVCQTVLCCLLIVCCFTVATRRSTISIGMTTPCRPGAHFCAVLFARHLLSCLQTLNPSCLQVRASIAGGCQAGGAQPESADRQLRPGRGLQARGAPGCPVPPAGDLPAPDQADLDQGQQRGLPGAGDQIRTAPQVGCPAQGFPSGCRQGES